MPSSLSRRMSMRCKRRCRPGVRAIVTNPPYAKVLLPKLVRHWLGLLEPIGGQLCLLLRVLWAESKGGQVLTTRHPAYHGKVKTPRRIQWLEGAPLDKGETPAEEHCWFLWDWRRDTTRMPFDASAGDARLSRRNARRHCPAACTCRLRTLSIPARE